MKGKRLKRSRKYLQNIYATYFSFRPPYQILLDSAFCQQALRLKLHPKESLDAILGGNSKLMITGCSLKKVEETATDEGVLYLAKRFEHRNCRHSKPLDERECFLDLLRPDNPHHYAVVTQSPEARASLRSIPGVPILFINRDILVMEDPSQKTLDTVKRLEKKSKSIPEVELKAIKLVAPVEKKKRPAKRRRNVKGPNPLSVKKPKKEIKQREPVEKEKRVRPRRKKRASLLEEVTK